MVTIWKEKQNKKLANARAAKERYRLERVAPEPLPIDREGDYVEIIIRGMMFGQYKEITYAMLPAKKDQGYCNQYALFHAGSNPLGVMGAKRVGNTIFSREFKPVRSARAL